MGRWAGVALVWSAWDRRGGAVCPRGCPGGKGAPAILLEHQLALWQLLLQKCIRRTHGDGDWACGDAAAVPGHAQQGGQVGVAPLHVAGQADGGGQRQVDEGLEGPARQGWRHRGRARQGGCGGPGGPVWLHMQRHSAWHCALPSHPPAALPHSQPLQGEAVSSAHQSLMNRRVPMTAATPTPSPMHSTRSSCCWFIK